MSRSDLVPSPSIDAAAPCRRAVGLSSDEPLEIVVRAALAQRITPRTAAAGLPLDADR